MTVIVPMRAAPYPVFGLAAKILAVSLATSALRRGFLALAARCAFRAAAAGGIAQRRRAARRHRHPARAGMEDLLAQSRRFRRAAAVRFLQVRQCRGGDDFVAGADEVRRRRRRLFARLQEAGGAAAAHRGQKRRQAGDPARRHQLRGLRQALHSRRSQQRTHLRERRLDRRWRSCRSARCRAEAG